MTAARDASLAAVTRLRRVAIRVSSRGSAPTAGISAARVAPTSPASVMSAGKLRTGVRPNSGSGAA